MILCLLLLLCYFFLIKNAEARNNRAATWEFQHMKVNVLNRNGHMDKTLYIDEDILSESFDKS